MNDELLIELVRQQPVLYDAKEKKYMDADWKARIWQEIGNEMGIEDCRCKARWNNIRDTFRKSLSKRRKRSGLSAKKMKPYRFEDQLFFLLDHMEELETEGKFESRHDGEESDHDEMEEKLQIYSVSSLETSSQPAWPPVDQQNPAISIIMPSSSSPAFVKPNRVPGEKKVVQRDTACASRMKYIREKRQNFGTRDLPTVTLDNPIDCFLFGVSSTLKSFSPYMQNLAKSEIFATVQRFELEALNSQTNEGLWIKSSPRNDESSHAQSVDDPGSPQDIDKEYLSNSEGL